MSDRYAGGTALGEAGRRHGVLRPADRGDPDKIAERLYVSSHTVKTEVKAVYRKLGVSSRNDAVQRATAIGLLGT
jgi:DNA-binding NarL/FixJ family response regulator